jgi:hypothetical protein
VGNEKLMRDMMVEYLKKKLARNYKDITVNPAGNPDLVLANHGLVLANLVVETEGSVTLEKAETWKALARPGLKLIVMIPKSSKVRATEILWEKGISDRVVLGTYEIAVQMP